MKKATIDDVKAYWQSVSRIELDAQGQRPTARDPYLQLCVEAVMEGYLEKNQRLLDIGCGDGLSTCRFAPRVREAVGVDYIDGLVARARANGQKMGIPNVSFRVGDAMDLESVLEAHGLFDVVTSIRCLINLATLENQAKAIDEIARCLVPGGIYMLSEGWSEGMDGLNSLRLSMGLPAISVVDFNVLISRRYLEAEASRYFTIEAYHSVGFYLLMSRVVQPLLTAPEPPRYDHRLNQIAQELQGQFVDRFTEFDCAGIYVLRRR